MEREQVEIAQSKQLEGQTFSFWTISDPTNVEAKPIPLPGWFRAPIDKAILLWQRESFRWEKVISDRLLQGKELTPKQQHAYNEWKSNETRSIVLDKKKQAQVVNLASKAMSSLKKTCLMVVIHMSTDASGLHISTGSGKLWKLQLLQGVEPISDQVPAEVDHFQGYCFVKALSKEKLQYCTLTLEGVLASEIYRSGMDVQIVLGFMMLASV